MPYCMYLRKSRADAELEKNGEFDTLERHKTILLNFCKNNNIPISEIYKEIVSGDSIDSRPEMQRLLDDVENGKWDGIVVIDIDRLSRGDSIDQGIILRTFKKNNVKIITPLKEYNPNDESDEEFLDFNLFFSRREYKMITRRIQRGRKQAAASGKFLSSVPPYGYDKVKIKDGKGYTLAPNEAEAEVVKLIFEMYTSGNGMIVIANALDEKGIKPRYRQEWSRSTISDILKNPVYIGKLRWSYRKEEKSYSDDGKMHKKRTVNKECVYVDGLHEAIISEETFNSAQRIRKENTRKSVKADLTLKNPLTGVLFCKKCGSPMTRLGANTRNKYDTVKCSNRYCDTVSAPIELVEQQLLNSLSSWLNIAAVNAEAIYGSIDNGVNKKALDSLKKELQTVSEQISKTYDLLEQGIYTTEMFTERNKLLSSRQREIEEKINDLESKLKEHINVKELKTKTIPRMLRLVRQYPTLPDAESKNNILKELLLKATYEKTVKNNKGTVDRNNFSIEIFPNLLSQNK